MAWGFHLIVDAKACDISTITNPEIIAAFTKDLVEQIDMKAYGDPMIVEFATHDPDKGGYSLVQLIETSNITAHFVSKNGDGYIDIFSCKHYSHETALAVIRKWFKPYAVGYRMLERQAK